MHLRVRKSDGGTEAYLHTKVMGTIAAALGECGCYQEGASEQLAEAITFYIRRQYGQAPVNTDEIHAMILAVLTDTGFEEAAGVLFEHRLMRQIRRQRLEVIRLPATGTRQARRPFTPTESPVRCDPWNKTVIVWDLQKQGHSYAMARMVAGQVEDKILRLGCRRVLPELIRGLVRNELWQMQQAEKALAQQEMKDRPREHASSPPVSSEYKHPDDFPASPETKVLAEVGGGPARDAV